MPRIKSPEVVQGARGPRGPETVTHARSSEEYPQVRAVELEPEQAHFVSAFKEYAIVIATEPDHVNSSGQIVRGKNKSVRFREFNLVTSDPDVIKKIRTGMGRAYGLRSEVWEKYQQDEDLATKALETAEAAVMNLPEGKQEEFLEKLAARFSTFKLPPKVQSERAVQIAQTT